MEIVHQVIQVVKAFPHYSCQEILNVVGDTKDTRIAASLVVRDFTISKELNPEKICKELEEKKEQFESNPKEFFTQLISEQLHILEDIISLLLCEDLNATEEQIRERVVKRMDIEDGDELFEKLFPSAYANVKGIMQDKIEEWIAEANSLGIK